MARYEAAERPPPYKFGYSGRSGTPLSHTWSIGPPISHMREVPRLGWFQDPEFRFSLPKVVISRHFERFEPIKSQIGHAQVHDRSMRSLLRMLRSCADISKAMFPFFLTIAEVLLIFSLSIYLSLSLSLSLLECHGDVFALG